MSKETQFSAHLNFTVKTLDKKLLGESVYLFITQRADLFRKSGPQRGFLNFRHLAIHLKTKIKAKLKFWIQQVPKCLHIFNKALLDLRRNTAGRQGRSH
jgi:hypothetical protein